MSKIHVKTFPKEESLSASSPPLKKERRSNSNLTVPGADVKDECEIRLKTFTDNTALNDHVENHQQYKESIIPQTPGTALNKLRGKDDNKEKYVKIKRLEEEVNILNL